MRYSFLLVVFIFSCYTSLCQEITGKVFDATNKEGLPGAVIVNKKDSITSVTDENGNFNTIIENYPASIVISYVGYKPLEVYLKEHRSSLYIGMNASEHHLNEVVIQATRFNQKLLDVPAAVHAVTEAEINRNDETMIMPVLNRIPGIMMESGNLNTNRLSIRGIGSRTPYGTNRVRAYFNDIPLTNGIGESTIEDIDLGTLERVEIIKGPASSVYGAGLGGTINLISKSPEYMQSYAQAKVIGGSYGLLNTQANIAYAFNEGSVVVGLNDLHSEGFRENSSYDRQSVTISSSILNDEGVSMDFLGSFIDLKSYIPSSINEETYRESPQSAATNWAEAEGYESYIKSFAGFSLRYPINNQFSHHSSLFFSFRDADEPRPFDILLENTVATGLRSRLEFEGSNRFRAQIGAEVFSDWYSWSTYDNLYQMFPGNGSIMGDILSNNKEHRNYLNLFLQLKLELTSRINIEGGFNFNKTSYSLTDLYAEDNIDQSGNYEYDPVYSPRLGIIYEVSDNWNMYFSASHGFSVPSLAETLTPEGLVNTEIKPETGINYELGTKGNWINERLYGEISVYHTDIRNLLVLDRVGPDQYIGINAGKTTHQGLELLLDYEVFKDRKWQLNPNISLTLTNYRFNEFINQEVDYSGNIISGFPSSIVNFGLDIRSVSGFYFLADYRHVSSAPLNDLNTLYNESYSLVNAKAGYKLRIVNRLNMELHAGVNNLLDTKYASMVLVNAVGFGGADPRYYYPGMPINLYAGLNLKYNFVK